MAVTVVRYHDARRLFFVRCLVFWTVACIPWLKPIIIKCHKKYSAKKEGLCAVQYENVLFMFNMFYIYAKMQTISAYISLTKQNNSGRFCGQTNMHKSTNKYKIW